jgi:hypothetical protein
MPATFASLGGYVCCYVVDAQYGRRVAAADSITRLRAYWSPCWDWLHLHVSAAAKDSSTLTRACTRVEKNRWTKIRTNLTAIKVAASMSL